MGGYWDTGKENADKAPAITRTMDRTEANTGRSMKNLEITNPSPRTAYPCVAFYLLAFAGVSALDFLVDGSSKGMFEGISINSGLTGSPGLTS